MRSRRSAARRILSTLDAASGRSATSSFRSSAFSEIAPRGLRIYAGKVFEKNHRAGAAARRHRDQPRTQVCADSERVRSAVVLRVKQPALEPAVQGRQHVLQRDHRVALQPVDHALGCGIRLPHDAGAVDHNHPVFHVLDNQLVHLREVGQINLTLRRQLLADHGPLGQHVCQPGRCEIGDRQQAGLRILGAALEKTQDFVGVLKQYCNGRDRGKKQRQLTSRYQPRSGQRRQQQQPESAGKTAAGIHQQHDEPDVAADLHRQLQRETFTGADHRKYGETESCVSGSPDQEQPHVAGSELQHVAEICSREQEQQRCRGAVSVEQLQRPPVRVRHAAGTFGTLRLLICRQAVRRRVHLSARCRTRAHAGKNRKNAAAI